MTSFVIIYDDTELDPQLPATKTLVEIHRKLNLPGTFGISTEPLEREPQLAAAYRSLFNSPEYRELFDVVPHTHTHPILFDHQSLGAANSPDLSAEFSRSRVLIEENFEREVTGFRSSNGYYGGFAGCREGLQLLCDHGYRWVSSFAMGPGDTVPAPLTQPFYYAADGFPDLLEIPGHDWHDNVLSGWPHLASAWPPCVPSGLPRHPPRTPREKFEVYQPNMDWSVENDQAFYSPCMHPRTICLFEPEATWIEMMLRHAMDIGMRAQTMSTFAAQWRNENPLSEATGVNPAKA